jgi:prophage maintenance system killer protein
MRLTVDDVLLIHNAAVRDLPQPLADVGSHELVQLERILDLADIGSMGDAVELAADVAAQLTLYWLFPTGNYRTAILVAAVIVDAGGHTLPADWTGLADLLLAVRGSAISPGKLSGQVRAWLVQAGCGSGA